MNTGLNRQPGLRVCTQFGELNETSMARRDKSTSH